MEYTTPQGFRDVLADEAVVRERIVRSVQDLFARKGYVPIETPTLESMEVMRQGGRVPASPFKFFDAQGNLVTMRPDVTLQVARMCATRLGDLAGPFRFRYTQRVYREADSQVSIGAREKKQMGVECIGTSGPGIDAEIIGLFAQALEVAGVADYQLSVATVGVLHALLAASGAPQAWKDEVLAAFHTSDFVVLDELCRKADQNASRFATAIRALSRIRGGRAAIAQARELVAPFGCGSTLDDLEATYDLLVQAGLERRILIDFSVMSSFDYYTGIVFEAFVDDLGSSLGGGGRYDKLLGAYGLDRPAAGFAFYLEAIQNALSLSQAAAVAGEGSGAGGDAVAGDAVAGDAVAGEDAVAGGSAHAGAADAGDAAAGGAAGAKRPLRIAVPKGSLNADAIAALADAGLDVTGLDDPGRSLVISNPGVDYIIVRPSDAPVFVELGAADCGICGQDSLLESGADVVQLVDLRFGACRFVVAESEGRSSELAKRYRELGSIRVATKYPRIARAHFARTGKQVEIVQLHGNIELGPLTGLADCIVDITATGTTLRENKLVVTDEVMSSTARFFANVCSLRTDERVGRLAAKLGQRAQNRQLKVTAGGSVEG